MERKFYDLGRINFWGRKSEIDWGFDESKVHAKAALPELDEIQKVFTGDAFHPKKRSVNRRPTAAEVRSRFGRRGNESHGGMPTDVQGERPS